VQLQNEYSEAKYFMTTQDQDAVIGRLMREQRELEARRSALGAEARRIQDNLISLGKALRDPSRVALDTEEVSPEFESLAMPFHRISLDELEEVKRILPLCRDYRETVAQLRLKAKSLEEAGWKK
jgi:hypothetical protein